MDIFETQVDSFDGVGLFCRSYKHPFPRGVVVFVHGFGDHSGRYEHLAEHLMVHGFSCLNYDQRSHGRSPGERGLLDPHETSVADCGAILRYAKSLSPGIPVFLMGHGSGGVVVAHKAASTEVSRGVRGVIMASIQMPSQPNVFSQGMMHIAGKLAPRVRLREGASIASLSRDPKVLSQVKKDP